MNVLVSPKRIELQKPAFEFYEEGEWMRIVVPGQPDRFLMKTEAQRMLWKMGRRAVLAKSHLSI